MKFYHKLILEQKAKALSPGPTEIWDYLLVFLLVATSGITYFYFNEEYIIISLILSLFLFLRRRKTDVTDVKAILIILIFIFWEILQSFYFLSLSLKSVLGTLARFAFAYLVIKNLGYKFVSTFINIIYFFSIISIIFYILFFFPQITNKLVSLAIKQPLFPLKDQSYSFTPNYILITFNQYQQFRNSGPFWEPGAFAIYLNIALMFNIIAKKKIINSKNLLFIVTIITTLSTAGFLTLFVILALGYLLLNPSVTKLFVLVPVVVLFIGLIVNLPFLLPKIKNNVIIADNDNSSRFGSALSDYQLIYENPILGYGRALENQFRTSTWDTKKMHRNNGITNFITQWGLILFVFYFYNYKKSGDNICAYFDSNKNLSIVFLISILLSGFSQGIFQYPFFHSLMFLQFTYYRNLSSSTIETESNIQFERSLLAK